MVTKRLYMKGVAVILRTLIGLVKEHSVFVDRSFVFRLVAQTSSTRDLIIDTETS
jgi:hypothetical protein